MSKVGPESRSFLPIEMEDLVRILEIARQDRKIFFEEHPQWGRFYEERVLGVALCQGAANHYLDGITGINDFDVYTFYHKHPHKNWYAKRIKSYDLGDGKFGTSVDKPDYVGRRVDCLSRSIEVIEGEEIKTALQRYLSEGKTKTAQLLSKKAVILLEPDCGEVIWLISAHPKT